MRKIPTLYLRTEDRKGVINEVNPGCEWVLNGEGRATRKIDGTCILIRREGNTVNVFARREVKHGKNPPPNFEQVNYDEVTGKMIGWEPFEQSGFKMLILEALDRYPDITSGTYELIGPKINGNPEKAGAHFLVRHGEVTLCNLPRTFDELRTYLLGHPEAEGIVWHHPDGRMVKLKRRDFENTSISQTEVTE